MSLQLTIDDPNYQYKSLNLIPFGSKWFEWKIDQYPQYAKYYFYYKVNDTVAKLEKYYQNIIEIHNDILSFKSQLNLDASYIAHQVSHHSDTIDEPMKTNHNTLYQKETDLVEQIQLLLSLVILTRKKDLDSFRVLFHNLRNKVNIKQLCSRYLAEVTFHLGLIDYMDK